jgi:hypothetical protein
MLTRHTKTLTILTLVTAILAATVGTASARRLALSSNAIRAIWNELRFSASGTEISCRLTLEGSLHERTIDKAPESLIGYITRAGSFGICSALTESLPWHLRYAFFEGRLPDIASIDTKITLMNFQISFAGVTCLYTTSATSPATLRFSRNTATRAITGVSAGGNIRSNTFGCPNGGFAGTGTVTELGTSNAITVTLI